ncbi:MAG: flagellar FliJ family protein [Candidatus Kapabacteria bacterium]|nr:flagellar FliJ family protein [Candidatus Kapabacteria bacterium]
MAKKFIFNLDTIHKLRTHKADLAKEALNQVAFLRHNKENEIENQQEYHKSLNTNSPKSTKVADLQAYQHHKSYVVEEIKRLEYEKHQLMEIEEFKRKELTDAQKQEKIIDKLKEKKFAEYKNIIDKEESMILDEIGINIYLKNQ